MARYGKSDRPQGNASNRAKRRNARDIGSGSRYTRKEHDKARRPPGKDQNNPEGKRGKPS